MSSKFTQSFKIQAVEKAMNRAADVRVRDVANSLQIGHSTLARWLVESKSDSFETLGSAENFMSNEKRPQDWSLEERLAMVIACSSLEGEALNQHCRERGVYAHHVKQWKQDFTRGGAEQVANKAASNMRALTTENKSLKSDLRRKEKALAEAAALLILQKKVATYWGSDEDNL